MKVVYLKSGQQAYLIEKTETGKFIVAPIVTVNNGEEDYEIEQPEIMVNEIFDKPPIEKISKELIELQDKVYEEKKKLNDATKEFNELTRKIKQQQEDASKTDKWKFDFSKIKTASNITFFVENEFMPVTNAVPKWSEEASLQLNINITKGVADSSFNISYWQDNKNYGNYKSVDEKYGFMYDLTPEQLSQIIIQRLQEKDYRLYKEYELNHIPKEFRDERWHNAIANIKEKSRLQEIDNLKSTIEISTQKLTELTA